MTHKQQKLNMENETQVLLEGEFFLYPLRLTKYYVKLTKQGITFSERTKGKDASKHEKHIHFGDVVGCRCKKAKTSDDPSAYFTVFSYQFKAKSKRKRQRNEFTFGLNNSSVFDENLRVCQKWRNLIVCFSRNITVNRHELELCGLPQSRRVLVFINPHSGPGKAQQIFENTVKPMLEEADIIYQVLITKYSGHATEVIKTLKIEEWSGVVIISGDGLIYEVINGLMARKDWDKAIKFPIGCIPGGSGNALCVSLNYLAGEPLDADSVLHSTFVLVKHRILPLDLVLLQTPTEQLYSFLSVAWGIIADIDYESEKLRSLGSTRFTLYAIMRILKLRTYRAKLSFLPIQDSQSQENGKKSNSVFFEKPRRYALFGNTNQDALSSVYDKGCAGKFSFSNGDDSERMRSQSMPSNMSEYLTQSFVPSKSMDQVTESNESLFNSEEGKEKEESGSISNEGPLINSVDSGLVDFNLNDTENNEVFDQNSVDETVPIIKDSSGPVPCPLLPPLDEPVPSNWVTIEGDFVTAVAVYLPYMGPDNLSSPDSRLNDGFINLWFIRGGVSKNEILNMFLQFSSGEHINSTHCDNVKCLAFRLEPQTKKGNIMVDGERINYGPIQGQVLPGIARVMAIQ